MPDFQILINNKDLFRSAIVICWPIVKFDHIPIHGGKFSWPESWPMRSVKILAERVIFEIGYMNFLLKERTKKGLRNQHCTCICKYICSTIIMPSPSVRTKKLMTLMTTVYVSIYSVSELILP